MLDYASPMFIAFDNIDLGVISPDSCSGGGIGKKK
jgi:hypothetical protein